MRFYPSDRVVFYAEKAMVWRGPGQGGDDENAWDKIYEGMERTGYAAQTSNSCNASFDVNLIGVEMTPSFPSFCNKMDDSLPCVMENYITYEHRKFDIALECNELSRKLHCTR